MSDQHRHFWQPTDEPGRYACTDCEETCAECIECLRWTGNSLLICERCVRRVRGLIDDIETAMALYCPPMPSLIPPIRYDRDQITGSRSTDGERRISVRDVWVDPLGGLTRGLMRPTCRARSVRLSTCAGTFCGPRTTATRVIGTSGWPRCVAPRTWPSERPTSRPSAYRPCVCTVAGRGADVGRQDLTPHADGLSDEVTCLGCHLTWRSAAHYAQVSKEHLRSLPEVQPDAIVTLDQAATVWPEVPPRRGRRGPVAPSLARPCRVGCSGTSAVPRG